MGTLDRISDWILETDTRAAFALLSTVLLLLGIGWIGAGEIATTASNRISLLSVFMNSLLTLLLISAYLEMVGAQEKQAKETRKQSDLQKEVVEIQQQQQEIQANQEQWMEASHKPVVEPENIGMSNDSTLRLDCANKGNGVATNFSIICEISVLVPTADSPLPRPVPIKEIENEYRTLEGLRPCRNPLQLADANVRTNDGVSLSPEESKRLETEIGLKRVDSPTTSDDTVGGVVETKEGFSEVVDDFQSEGLQRLKFDIFLYYEGVLEREYRDHLFDVYADVESGLTFEDAVRSWKEDHQI